MVAANRPELRTVFRVLHRPLTVCGIERRLFFLALIVGAAAFNLFYSLLAGCILTGALHLVFYVAASHDPQFLQIALRSGSARVRYDAAKHAARVFSLQARR